jgi:peptidyl-Lys metalloendopeptidase
MLGSILTTHLVSEAYNFTASGDGRYSIEPGTLFHFVDESEAIIPIWANLNNAHATHVSGKLAIAHPTSTDKRATYNGCSTAQQTTLTAAVNAGNSYAAEAYSYAASHTFSTLRYTTVRSSRLLCCIC